MKSLICITSCNRLTEVKKFIWDYILFCNSNDSFDFILALDGSNEEYISFCQEFEIPLIFSEEREGVGITKNRVFKSFPDYEYYFFVEDDIELIDNRIFQLHIDLSIETGYPHFTVTNYRNPIGVIKSKERLCVIKALYGGAHFNFFSKAGILAVGGWHTLFSVPKRFGHTEHSYRFYHRGIQPAPFLVVEQAQAMVIIHDPVHVTKINDYQVNPETHLVTFEEELIKEKISFFPITTISPISFNGFNLKKNARVENFINLKLDRYPFLKGKLRRVALAEHYFYRIAKTNNVILKIWFFLKSFLFYPLNIPFKHFIKTKVLSYGR